MKASIALLFALALPACSPAVEQGQERLAIVETSGHTLEALPPVFRLQLSGLPDSVPLESIWLIEGEVSSVSSGKLMREEIFGPVLSVVTVPTVDDAIRYTDSITRDPLALYVFSSRKTETQRILAAIPSGGAVVNDCMVHQGLPHLPFGGRGLSGLGTYHGRYSFETFSQKRTILYKHGNRDHPLLDF